MDVILDTDHLTVIQRGTEPAYSRLRSRLSRFPPANVKTTIVSFEEQLRGRLAVISRSRNRASETAAYKHLGILLRFFSEIPVLDYTEDAESRYDEFRKSRVRVGPMDLRIAAIACSSDALLLSANLKDFGRVPNLRVENWIH